MSEADLPFRVEYSKSNRAGCKMCKIKIEKDELRFGIMVQSPHFDGKIPLWHHFNCFFKKKRLTTTGDVANFATLRWDDQKRIKDKVVGGGTASTSETSTKAAAEPITAENKDFSVEYAKSSRSICKVCEDKIIIRTVRISKLNFESESSMRYGPQPGWHHVDCFVAKRNDLGFTGSADNLPGFNVLSVEDKEILLGKIKAIGGKRKVESKEVEKPAKKMKVEESKEDKALKTQSKLFYDVRDKIQKELNKKEMLELLELNEQTASAGESSIMDLLADCLVFGALKPCPECENGQLNFRSFGYKCSGSLTAYTKCQYVTQTPDRVKFNIPDEYRESYAFLKKYKYVERVRVFPEKPENPSAGPSTSNGSTKESKPLDGFKIAALGKLSRSNEEVEKIITELGGKFAKKIDKSITCIITTEDEADKNDKRLKTAERHDVFVVSEKFLDSVKNGGAALMVKQHMIRPWGGDPTQKIVRKFTKVEKSKGSSGNFESQSQKIKLVVQGSAAVDPASGLESSTHVVEKKGDVFNAVLGLVDITRGTNSYYKLQVLQSNHGNRFFVFRAWGRVGTTIGNNKKENFDTLQEAILNFKEVYLEKTGNDWEDRANFVKQPGRFQPLDIDYGQDDAELQKFKELKPGSKSSLPKAIQELICLIFDVEAMKQAMLEFEIDLKKMPLGKLSKKQIQSAYLVLTELQQLLQSKASETKILDASNRFYTLIPHDFGLRKPPLVDSDELLKSKIQMLDSLLEIEFAYNLMKEGDSRVEDPVDKHYHQLKTDIEILDKKGEEFKRIDTYIKNTHADTHNQYGLKLEEVFKINREGESERYKKFNKLHNKKLLWHGSRVTNYPGILSQGLRIAPPEAPVTGYMFGKGIYFADMVSKSANYCFSNQSNPTGLLMLCEVALGNMYEKTQAEYVEKLPKDKHSTKGIGQTEPDPSKSITDNGVEIPLGKPTKTQNRSALLYNEYIVYDVNQVNIKYLLKVNFNWKRF